MFLENRKEKPLSTPAVPVTRSVYIVRRMASAYDFCKSKASLPEQI